MIGVDEIPFVVKVCGVAHFDDARIAVEAGANAIGFNFYSKSPRFVTPEQAADIAARVVGHYLRVGVFVYPSVSELMETAKTVPLDVVQVHGELPEGLPADLRVWRAIAPTRQPPKETKAIEAYLLDTPSEQYGGAGIAFQWDTAAGFDGRAILAGGLHGGNVAEAIRVAQPWGVDACSRLETGAGRKDARRVHEFVEAAWRAARAHLALEITI